MEQSEHRTGVKGTAENRGSLKLAVGIPTMWPDGQPGASGKTGCVLGLGTREGASRHGGAGRRGSAGPTGPGGTQDDQRLS